MSAQLLRAATAPGSAPDLLNHTTSRPPSATRQHTSRRVDAYWHLSIACSPAGLCILRLDPPPGPAAFPTQRRCACAEESPVSRRSFFTATVYLKPLAVPNSITSLRSLLSFFLCLYLSVREALKLRSLPFTHPIYVASRYFQ